MFKALFKHIRSFAHGINKYIVHPITFGIKALCGNLKKLVRGAWHETNWAVKTCLFILSCSAAIYYPSLSTLVAASIFDCGPTVNSLVTSLIMFVMYFILYAAAAYSVEILIPFVFLAFCEWIVWSKHEYKSSCENIG